MNFLEQLIPENGTTKEESDRIHRLRNLLIRSVHLVDRGANGRRFVLTKRQQELENMTQEAYEIGPEVVENPETGTLTRAVDATVDGDSTSEVQKTNLVVPTGTIKQLEDTLAVAAKLSEAIKDAEEKADATMPDDILKKLQTINNGTGAF